MGLRWNADWSHLLKKTAENEDKRNKILSRHPNFSAHPNWWFNDFSFAFSSSFLSSVRRDDEKLAGNWLDLAEGNLHARNVIFHELESRRHFFLLADGDVEMLGWKFKSQVLLESEKSFKTSLNKIIFYWLIFRSELLFNFWRYKLFCLLFSFAHPWMRLHHVLFLHSIVSIVIGK